MATGASDMVLAIRRARKYSPNSVEKDSAILDSVVGRIAAAGFAVATVSEEACQDIRPRYGMCLSMGRNAATLALLDGQESQDAVVVNASRGVRLCCQRSRLNATLGRAGVPLPPSGMGAKGCWLKRGDGVAETKGDVRFVATPVEMAEAVREMKVSGIGDIVAQAHVEGDVVKFYGVRGTGFFRTYYPGDDGQTKFGDEERNGKPHHYAFDGRWMHAVAEKAAGAVEVDVYGGDCIVRPDGTFCVIDFNDWPSFSRCRDEAAEAIARLALHKARWT